MVSERLDGSGNTVGGFSSQFAEKTRILVSTDAGGEGLNLQFAHIVINYDLPWNPMRIEQRIGRVDRIGQKYPVKAFNLIFEDSVELRVRKFWKRSSKQSWMNLASTRRRTCWIRGKRGHFERLLRAGHLTRATSRRTSSVTGPGGARAGPNAKEQVARPMGRRSGPRVGAAAEQPSSAVLGGTDDDGLPAGRRRQGSARTCSATR